MHFAGKICSLLLPFLLKGGASCMSGLPAAEPSAAFSRKSLCHLQGRIPEGKIREKRSQPVDPVNYKKSGSKGIAVPRMDALSHPLPADLLTGPFVVQIVPPRLAGQLESSCKSAHVIRPPPAL